MCIVSVLPALSLWRALERITPAWLTAYDYKVFSLGIVDTGIWAIIFLFITLSCSPVQAITRLRWPAEIRRTLGLFAFGYVLLHFAFYLVVGQKLRFDYALKDAVLTKSRLPGWASMLLLVPLAVSSTDGMVRWLGGKAWKRLHLLVFPATALAIWHIAWTQTDHGTDDFQRTRYAVVTFAILIALRLLSKLWKFLIRRRRAASPR